ncbi:MAG: helix-turn-helix domain-containing protein [Muribaculaceae bacterium]|nr:helix-turn-helix domain-containing protein [Muribaculaceae bacterium]
MAVDSNSNSILAILENFTFDNSADIMIQVAEDFRKRRVEKNITRQRMSELSGVPLSTLAHFEQKGPISFESLIKLAMALGYTSEIKNLFSAPKFNTMKEHDLIRQKRNNKRAYPKRSVPGVQNSSGMI